MTDIKKPTAFNGGLSSETAAWTRKSDDSIITHSEDGYYTYTTRAPVTKTRLKKQQIRDFVINFFTSRILTSTQKLVLLLIVERYNLKKGIAYPKKSTLALEACLGLNSIGHVGQILRKLEQLKIIVRVERFNASGRQTSNGYALHPTLIAFMENQYGLDE